MTVSSTNKATPTSTSIHANQYNKQPSASNKILPNPHISRMPPRGKSKSNAESESDVKASASQPRGEFENFMRLPAEIRIMIWRYGLVVPRVIKFNCMYYIDKRHFHRPWPGQIGSFREPLRNEGIPPLLHVCRESRHEALVFGGFEKSLKALNSPGIPTNRVRPSVFIHNWLPFRPDTDIAFISTYEMYTRPDYAKQLMSRKSIYCRRLKHVVLSKTAVKELMKYRKNIARRMERIMEAFPGMEELTILFTDSPDVFNVNDYRLNGKVTYWETPGEAHAESSMTQSTKPSKLIIGRTPSRKVTINIDPIVWEYLHLFV